MLDAQREHGVMVYAYRCLNCGRYEHVAAKTNAIEITQDMKGTDIKRLRLSANDKRRIKQLVADGYWSVEIGRIIGCNHQTVINLVNRNGWDIKKGQGRKCNPDRKTG